MQPGNGGSPLSFAERVGQKPRARLISWKLRLLYLKACMIHLRIQDGVSKTAECNSSSVVRMRQRLTMNWFSFQISEAKVSTLQKVAMRLRSDAAILSSLRMEREARKLQHLASDCEDEAFNILPNQQIPSEQNDGHPFSLQTDDPWIITRRRGDLELRTFVENLSIITGTLFGKTLHGTLATVANVRFNREDVTHRKVWEMLRLK